MTEDVHVPLSLRYKLPIGIPGGLVPLKAPNKLPEAVAMLHELCTEGSHRGFGLQVGIGVLGVTYTITYGNRLGLFNYVGS